MRAKLGDGYEITINDGCANDWNFLKLLRRIEKGESSLIVDVAEVLLGSEEEVDKLAEHLEVNGVTPTDAMVEALTELMESVNELKNSEPSPA